MANAKHSSASVEHFSPRAIVERARWTLRAIDLDPATTERINRDIKAKKFYTKETDGFTKTWHGRVFLNPPGGLLPMGTKPSRSRQAHWWNKLATEWHKGSVESAIFIGFSLEILQGAQSFDGLQPLDFPFCVPSARIQFDELVEDVRRAQKSPSHANIIVYLPPRNDLRANRFVEAFSKIGRVRT